MRTLFPRQFRGTALPMLHPGCCNGAEGAVIYRGLQRRGRIRFRSQGESPVLWRGVSVCVCIGVCS